MQRKPTHDLCFFDLSPTQQQQYLDRRQRAAVQATTAESFHTINEVSYDKDSNELTIHYASPLNDDIHADMMHLMELDKIIRGLRLRGLVEAGGAITKGNIYDGIYVDSQLKNNPHTIISIHKNHVTIPLRPLEQHVIIDELTDFLRTTTINHNVNNSMKARY